jgi:uncharacterized protein (DUF433 family)
VSLPAATEPIPLTTDPQGVIRVGGTRVTLDTIVEVYEAGSRPEEIARHYPSVDLADVFAVITYYLRHREEVQEYLARRREHAAAVRRENEAGRDRENLRQRLLDRLAG